MQGVSLLILGAMISSTVAHYGNWVGSRNVVFDEEEPYTPCLTSKQVSMQRCDYGIYLNKKCGMRPDCLQGPGEICTEKWEDDPYGLKCAAGLICSKKFYKCIGATVEVDSNDLVQKRSVHSVHRPLVRTYDY